MGLTGPFLCWTQAPVWEPSIRLRSPQGFPGPPHSTLCPLDGTLLPPAHNVSPSWMSLSPWTIDDMGCTRCTVQMQLSQKQTHRAEKGSGFSPFLLDTLLIPGSQ